MIYVIDRALSVPDEGFLCFLHMSSLGLYTVFWPDMFHRITRRVAAGLGTSGANKLLRKLNKIFKYSRGPFATSKNGRAIQECTSSLVSALKKGTAAELADMYLASIARDVGRDPCDFTLGDLIHVIEKKSGTLSRDISHQLFL